MNKIYVGDIRQDSKDTRGWIFGHFMPEGSPGHSTDVEIKWGEHKKGEKRDTWSLNGKAAMASIVVKGKMRVIFEDKDVVVKEGQYLVAPPNIPHKWIVEEDCLVLTVRWPSLPADHQDVS
ncbi:MAG: cupin domain-containing protein [Patescibacteria group bacterium]